MPDLENGSSQQQIDPRKLYRAIVNYFDLNGLRELCLEVRIDFDNLREGGKDAKSLDLVQQFLQMNRLAYLATVFRELRPNVALDDIVLTSEDATISLDTFFIPRPTQPENRSATLIVGKSITSLIRLLSEPQVLTAVTSFRRDFEAASHQINLLNDQKQLHDLFQGLEDCYHLVVTDQKKLPADDNAWVGIEINEPELQSKISDLLTVATRDTFAADETRWVSQLTKAKTHIRDGLEEFDHEDLRRGTRLIFRILNRQPSRINAQLVTAASAIRLDALESALRSIAASLTASGLEHDLVAAVQNGVNELAGLDGRLRALVREHNQWQELDDEIRRIDTTGDTLAEDVQDAWIDLEPMLEDIVEGKDDPWADDIRGIMEKLHESVDQGSFVRVRRMFVRLRSKMGQRFRKVDVNLLSLCQEMQRVGESLDLLLRQFKK